MKSGRKENLLGIEKDVYKFREQNVGTRTRFLEIQSGLETQHVAPLAESDEIIVNASEIALPANLQQEYGANLSSLLTTLCQRLGMDAGTPDTVTLKGIVPLLTSKEFTPAFTSPNGKLHTAVASFPLDGSGPLLFDNACSEYTSISCTGGQKKPYAAQELPNGQIMIVHLIYDFTPKEQQLSVEKIFRERGLMSADARGKTMLPIPTSFNLRRDFGPLQAFDQTEEGARELREICVFVVSPMLTNEQQLTVEEVDALVSQMRLRADGVRSAYDAYKIFRYDDISNDFERHLRDFKVSTRTDIVENSLLKVAGIDREPTGCSYSDDGNSVIVRFGLPQAVVNEFVEKMNARFPDVCSLAGECNNYHFKRRGDKKDATTERNAVRIKLSAFAYGTELMQAARAAATQILSDARVLKIYQEYTKDPENEPSYEEQQAVFKIVSEIVKPYKMDIHKSPIVGVVLARMFGCADLPVKTEFTNGKGYLAVFCEMALSLDIPAASAQLIIDGLNHKFGAGSARLASVDAPLCVIGLDRTLFSNPDFTAAFTAKLAEIHEMEPMLCDRVREYSGDHSTSGIIHVLSLFATTYKDNDKREIGESLDKLKTTLSDGRATMKDRKEAGVGVIEACRLWKSTHTIEEKSAFLGEDEFEIQQLLAKLNLK